MKEKDFSQFQFTLKELKEDSDKKGEEIHELKASNTLLLQEIKSTKERKLEMETHFQNEIGGLKTKYRELEFNVANIMY